MAYKHVKDLLKIQYGDVYIQVPTDDSNAIKDILDWLQFLVKEVEKFKQRKKVAEAAKEESK